MKKILTIVAFAFIVIAAPVFAVVQGPDGETQNTTRPTVKTRTSYSEDVEGIQQRVQDLKQAREEEREQKREEISAASVKLANKKIDNIIKRYKAIQARVAKMEVISEDLKKKLNDAIGAEITKLQGYKEELNDAKTVEEVKLIMEKMKADVKSGKEIVKEVVAAIRASYYTNLLTRLQTVLEKQKTKIETLNEEDKTTLTKTVGDIQAKLDSAKTLISEGKTAEAKVKLQEARLDMVKLNVEIKKASKNITATEDEEEAEATEESTNDTTIQPTN